MQCNDDLGLVSLVLLAFSAALGGSALQGLRVQPDGHRFRRVQHRLLVFQRVHHRFVFPSLVLPVLFFALQDSNSSSQSAGCRVSEAPHPTQVGNGAKTSASASCLSDSSSPACLSVTSSSSSSFKAATAVLSLQTGVFQRRPAKARLTPAL